MPSESIIQSLQINFNAESSAGSESNIEQNVYKWKDDYLIPGLNSWINEFDKLPIHLRLDKLEIQVSSSSKNWQKDVLQQVEHQLVSKIRELQSGIKHADVLQTVKNLAEQPAGIFSLNNQPDSIITAYEQQSKAQSTENRFGSYNSKKNTTASDNTEDLLACILQHGILPWWSEHLGIVTIRERIDEWIRENEMSGSTWFVFNTERLRVSKLFAGQLLLKFFEKYGTQTTERLTALYQAIQKLKATDEQTVSFDGFIEDVFLNMPAFDSANSFAHAINKIAEPGKHRLEKYKELDKLQTVAQSIVNRTDKQKKEDAILLVKKLSVNFNSEKAIFIANAGAVLFAPFLPVLFTKLDLLNKGELKDVEACLSLIHYTATGINDAGEFELVLPKILCGLPPSEPAFYKPLNEIQREEVTNLIQSVIVYWASLKNTSPQTLRETFFCRKGKLYRSNDSWQLLVEQNAVDVLLQSVAWNFSMIKFSWMKEMLMTEWNY